MPATLSYIECCCSSFHCFWVRYWKKSLHPRISQELPYVVYTWCLLTLKLESVIVNGIGLPMQLLLAMQARCNAHSVRCTHLYSRLVIHLDNHIILPFARHGLLEYRKNDSAKEDLEI
jgi:hypothetical protein